MTAINVLRNAGFVHICTDGLCDLGGGDSYLTSKVYVAPHVSLVIAGRGASIAPSIFGIYFHQAFTEFDELVAGIDGDDMFALYE